MNSTIQTKSFINSKLSHFLLILTLFTLTGCSTIDAYRTPSQPVAKSLPKIPEIKRQQVVKPRYVPPKKAVVRAPIKSKPQLKIYSSQTKIKSKVATVKKPQLTQQQQLAEKQRLQRQAQQNATVDVDPYATIPESSSNQTSVSTSVNSANSKPTVVQPSAAVKTLMTSARADIAIGRSRSAISKLERGLRIESGNAQLWHLLAKAHYSNSAFLHAISIAKKSNANTNNTDLINENWKLIRLAGEKSGNASAIKEALDFMKLNP